jgi:3-hydroxybutyrate dehydrogenase
VNRMSYVTTKTALIGITRAVALETRDQDITCNAVCPGTVETPVHIQTDRRHDDLEFSLARGSGTAIPREQAARRAVYRADDVAGMILFLCGPESRDITGAALPIDGGWSIS